MKNKFLLIMLMSIMGVFVFFDISKANAIIPKFETGILKDGQCHSCEQNVPVNVVEIKQVDSVRFRFLGCTNNTTGKCKYVGKVNDRQGDNICDTCGSKIELLTQTIPLYNIMGPDIDNFNKVKDTDKFKSGYIGIPGTEYYFYEGAFEQGRVYYVANDVGIPEIKKFDPNEVNLYIEVTAETETSVQNGYEIDSFMPEVVGLEGDSIGFWLHTNCSKCSNCGEMVATNGKLYYGDSGNLVVSKNCSVHTCGFFSVTYIGSFNRNGITIGESWEELECLELVNSTRFCAAHKCGACQRPIVGCNFLDGRTSEVATYVFSDAAKYSNYCVNHSCLAYWCKNPNKNVSNTLNDGRDGYCSYHSEDEYGEAVCLIAGCNNKVVKDSSGKYPVMCADCEGKDESSVKTCAVCWQKVIEDNSAIYKEDGYGYVICNECILTKSSMDEAPGTFYIMTDDGQKVSLVADDIEGLTITPSNTLMGADSSFGPGFTPLLPERLECNHRDDEGNLNVMMAKDGSGWKCKNVECGAKVDVSPTQCKSLGGGKHLAQFVTRTGTVATCNACGAIIDDDVENVTKCDNCALGKHTECTKGKVDDMKKDFDDGKCYYLCCCGTHCSRNHIDTKLPEGKCDICGKKVAADEGDHYCYKCKKTTEWKKDAKTGEFKCLICLTKWEDNDWGKVYLDLLNKNEMTRICTRCNEKVTVDIQTIDGEIHYFCSICGYCVTSGCGQKLEIKGLVCTNSGCYRYNQSTDVIKQEVNGKSHAYCSRCKYCIICGAEKERVPIATPLSKGAYTGTKTDRRKLNYLLYTPEDMDPDKPLPLIVYYHGGAVKKDLDGLKVKGGEPLCYSLDSGKYEVDAIVMFVDSTDMHYQVDEIINSGVITTDDGKTINIDQERTGNISYSGGAFGGGWNYSGKVNTSIIMSNPSISPVATNSNLKEMGSVIAMYGDKESSMAPMADGVKKINENEGNAGVYMVEGDHGDVVNNAFETSWLLEEMLKEMDRNASCSCGSGSIYKECCGKDFFTALSPEKLRL